MSKRLAADWLSDIVLWGERLQGHLQGVDRDAFFLSTVLQGAASKCAEAIGEAAGKLDDIARLERHIPGLESETRAEERPTGSLTDIIGSTSTYFGIPSPLRSRKRSLRPSWRGSAMVMATAAEVEVRADLLSKSSLHQSHLGHPVPSWLSVVFTKTATHTAIQARRRLFCVALDVDVGAE
jgi:hypothetical protein